MTRCWTQCGFRACPYEILLDSSSMDILSPVGFLVIGRSSFCFHGGCFYYPYRVGFHSCHLRFAVAVCMALRLRRGGCSLLATVCSSWVFLSRASTGRSIWNPLGFRKVKVVEDANVSWKQFLYELTVLIFIGVLFPIFVRLLKHLWVQSLHQKHS